MSLADKKTKVESIIRDLDDDLSKNTLSDTRRQSGLEQLKVYGRDPNGANAIYCKSGITTLSRYAFGAYSSIVVKESLRVIANALLLEPSLQGTFIELEGLTQIARLYQNQEDDFEFLGGRILFVCTYAAKADFEDAFSCGLLGSIEKHLTRHAEDLKKAEGTSQPMSLMAMIETTKLIFNLNNKYPQEYKPLNAVVPDLCTVLQYSKIASPPLDQPTGPLLNALACLDFGAVPAQSLQEDSTSTHQTLVGKLVDILDQSTKQYKPAQLDILALSLLTVLRMLYDTSSPGVQSEMRARIFPADSERDLPLGQSSTLASRILRLTTSPGLSHLPEAIASLLFEMSDKDAGKFIKNIGYGYAAGYLMTHKIPIPESLKDATTTGSSTNQVPVNPVTGQRLDTEPVSDMPEMTQEEKEREAERLFVLFERLKATGVVNVENPLTTAREQGRFEEVADADSDSD